MEGPRSSARFPGVGRGSGHYESFYLKVADPAAPRGAWIRHTIFKRPGEPAVGSLWCTVWEDGVPAATKVTLAAGELGVRDGEYVHVGESRLVPGHAVGEAPDAAWDLSWDGVDPVF